MTKVNSLVTNKSTGKKKSGRVDNRGVNNHSAQHESVMEDEVSESDLHAQIYSIAILLTGCADDAQQVVDEVTFALQLEQTENNETLETRVHRLTYDSALIKLLNQVNRKSSKLEEATNKILTTNNYLA